MDNKFFLRLAEIKMKDFMGVEYGELTFSRLKRDWNDEEKIWKSNVVGIYGPNGSSKTTVVESLQLLKRVFYISKARIDSKLRKFLNPPFPGHYIRVGSDTAELTFLFHCCSDEGPIAKSFRYSFSITGDDPLKIENELFQILDEKGKAIHSLSTKGIADNPTDFFESLVDPNQTIPRLSDNTSICNDISLILQYSKILPASQKKEARILFNQFAEIITSHLEILFEDREKAALRNDSLPTIPIPLIPFSKSTTYGLYLNNGEIIGRNHLLCGKKETVSETLLRQVNFLSDTLETLVPNIRLSVKDEKDKLVMYVDKDGVSIPLEKESYGIKKLIYLCCYIPALFQSSAYMLIIDELDEGLFEHLLGSILMAIQNKAEGQLIFTAHNLRPLQCLDHGSIRFALLPSDTDKDQTKKTNQYSEINCLNKRSNLRDIYYNALNTEE